MTSFFCRVAASSHKVIELTTIPVKIIAGDPVSPLERHGVPAAGVGTALALFFAAAE